MNASYVEFSFKMPTPMWRRILQWFLIILGVFLILISPYFIPVLSVGMFSILLAYFIWRDNNIELEYTLIEDDLYIDKIIANRKRKRLDHIPLIQMEVLLKKDQNSLMKYQNEKVKVKRYYNPSQEVYALMLRKGNQTSCILLNANDKLIDAMKKRYGFKVQI